MDNMISKQELIRKIQELSFAAVELNLFLDTHPNNTQAIQDYNYIVNNLQQCHNLYNQKFGPIMGFGLSPVNANNWTWAAEDEKWPWERTMGV